MSIQSQVRFDPLTGLTGRVAHFLATKNPPPDLGPYDTPEARAHCPFCPTHIQEVTPKFLPEFIPEGRLNRAEAWLIPNLSPYDEYSGLVVISAKHLVTLKDFTQTMLTNAFTLAQDYLKRIHYQANPPQHYLFGWNYLPPAGSSQPHPHLQVFATDHPGNHYQRELLASEAYLERHGSNYWADLVATEEQLGERFLGRIGGTTWLGAFVPLGTMGDFLCIFPDKTSIFDLNQQDWLDLASGLLRAFQYYHDQGLYSFNLAFYPGNGRDSLWTHCRISARTFVRPDIHTSDASLMQLYLGEPVAFTWPEDVCRAARGYFRQK